MSIVVKFACDGEFRRARISSLTWEEVAGAASASFPEFQQGNFDLKYRDDEDDLCLLSPATFPDFASLNEEARNVRLELVKKVRTVEPGPSAPPRPEPPLPADAGADAAMGDGGPPAGGPGLRGLVQGVLGGLLRASAPAGGNAVAAIFVHFAPQLLGHVRGAHADIDRVAAEKPEHMRSLIQALREALEPFPQVQETQIALDRMLQAEHLEGVGSATETFLQALIQLPFEQQRDIVSVAFEGVFEKLLQLMPEEAPQPAEAWVHRGVTCDGCGATPILGPRFKCAECPDYDLCGPCYMQKDVLHPGHKFSCGPHSRGKGKGKGFGPCPLFGSWAKGWGKEGWKGWCKGLGKGWGKGWGKGQGSGSDSSDSSFSDGSDSSHSSKARGSAANWKSIKHELRAAKHAWKTAKSEAKEKWKAAKKAWKKELKQDKKAKKEHAKQERKAMKLQLRTAAAEQPKAQGPSLSFPVEVADGRRLTISWSRGEGPEQVAVRFATQHGIAEDELPAIADFVRHAEAAVAGGGTPVASEPEQAVEMDVSEPVPSAPPAEATLDEEHMQSLEAMGFTNRELNAQLLAANEGNLHAVLEKLL